MTAAEARAVIVERDWPFPPDRVWRALTEPLLLEEWLMTTDFKPEVGHGFAFRADWGSVDCRVLAVEPPTTLSYTWCAHGLDSTVTWTITPTDTGSHVRMEQVGFRPDQQQAYQGATFGWRKFFGQLEQVLPRLD